MGRAPHLRRLAGSGVCERVEGLPLEQFVGLEARMTGGDARMLVTCGRVLADLPVVAGLFAAGGLGWGQVRAIVSATRSLSRGQRRLVDERVAATVDAYGPGVGAFDPDGLVWAVDDAAAELRPTHTERAERRRRQGSFLARQMDFDGGMRCHGQFDPVAAAIVDNALDVRMGGRPPAGAGQPGHAATRHANPPGAATHPTPTTPTRPSDPGRQPTPPAKPGTASPATDPRPEPTGTPARREAATTAPPLAMPRRHAHPRWLAT